MTVVLFNAASGAVIIAAGLERLLEVSDKKMSSTSRGLAFICRAVLPVVLFATLGVAHASALSDIFGDAPLVRAINDESVEKANAALLDGASPTMRAADGTPVIVLAVSVGNLDLVTLLIENGARPDDRAKDETTALTLAASNGHIAIVTYLLDHKADIDHPGSLRETALIKAVRFKRDDVVKLLIERGADLSETDSGGATALDIAQRNGSANLAAMLKKAASK